MEDSPLIPLSIDLLAVAVGALLGASWALTESKRPLAITGVTLLAISTGLGGGILRDVFINEQPAAFRSNWYLGTVLIAVAVTWLAVQVVTSLRAVVIPLDAATIGIYACVGVLKAERAGMADLGVILVGVLAAVGGVVIRDLLVARVPDLLQPGLVYGVAALVAALSFYLLGETDIGEGIRFAIAASLGFLTRMASVWFGWHLPAVQGFEFERVRRHIPGRRRERRS